MHACLGGCEGCSARVEREGPREDDGALWVGCRVGASRAHRAGDACVDAELLEHHVPVLRVGANGDAARLRSIRREGAGWS